MFPLDLEINRALLTSASAVSEGAVGGSQGGEKKRQVQTSPSRNCTGKAERDRETNHHFQAPKKAIFCSHFLLLRCSLSQTIKMK